MVVVIDCSGMIMVWNFGVVCLLGMLVEEVCDGVCIDCFFFVVVFLMLVVEGMEFVYMVDEMLMGFVEFFLGIKVLFV